MARTEWYAVGCILGVAASGSAAVLLVPAQFNSDDPGSVWVIVALLCLVVVLGMGARYWRPDLPHTRDRR